MASSYPLEAILSRINWSENPRAGQYRTVRQAAEAEKAARAERAAALQSSRQVLLRKVLPALSLVLGEVRAHRDYVKAMSQPGFLRSVRQYEDSSLRLGYAPRLFELEQQLGILTEDDASSIANAIERVRQYEWFIDQLVPPDTKRNPFTLDNLGALMAPYVAHAEVAVTEALRRFQPGAN